MCFRDVWCGLSCDYFALITAAYCTLFCCDCLISDYSCVCVLRYLFVLIFSALQIWSFFLLVAEMSDEEKSVDVGVPKAEVGEDVTEDDIKLIKALKLLGIKPKLDSLSDLQKVAQAFQVEKVPVKEQTPGMASSRQQQTEGTSHHFPNISVFYGESGKWEVSWESWKYEVEALIN